MRHAFRRNWLSPLAGAVVVAMAAQARAGAPTPLALPQVDLNRIYGAWYIVATIPNSFERGMVAPRDVYSPGGGSAIQEDFYVRRGGFDAPVRHFKVHDWVRPGTHNAHWRVRIFWPIDLPFLVLYADPQYRYVLFGEENRRLGWIYSRTPTLSEADYDSLLDRLAALGYDRTRFRKIVQTRDQIGKPGFWSDGIKPSRAVAAGGE